MEVFWLRYGFTSQYRTNDGRLQFPLFPSIHLSCIMFPPGKKTTSTYGIQMSTVTVRAINAPCVKDLGENVALCPTKEVMGVSEKGQLKYKRRGSIALCYTCPVLCFMVKLITMVVCAVACPAS